ncbi:MAG: serine--tRNA ligase [Clostridiales bacterium]|nr:serine--tRNA ligase [Clostridiales bacterium]
MLDMQMIRENPERVRAALLKRGRDVDFAELLNKDAHRRALIAESESLKAERNRISKEIPRLKKAGDDVSPLLARMKQTADRIRELDELERAAGEWITGFVGALPNLPDEDVAAGGKESNVVVRTGGEKPVFDFPARDHMELARSLGLVDYERGVKLGGNGFWLYTDRGARLEWALINYFIGLHIADGYTFVLPPHLLNYECGYTAGQFPKFEQDVFRLEEEGFQFLLPTAETALVNLYRDEIIPESALPRRLFAYTPCYRREAGSYRAGERGMIRGHQFNKVEMFAFARPEDSDSLHRELIGKAEAIMNGLGLHYRLTKLAAGDVSASMASTYDIEVWLPGMDDYKEVSSVSNARDYQARRGNMRFRRESTRKTEFVHTLNGSGMATSRLFPAILEQFQQKDGSVVVPEPLRAIAGCAALEPV